ncbi:MAG: DUF421 domain-containing protein [Verrucomicrobia bacterium]|nr:DUF421 domain-containing protein [Verrucomicrobiota bacterium]
MDLDLFDLLGLGKDPGDFTSLQVSLRAAVIFFTALILVRFGAKRFLARNTAFDVILAFILGSTLSRTINNSAPLLPTIVACLVLVLLHRLLAALSFHFHHIGSLLKGNAEKLISDGKIDPAVMRKHYLSEKDLMEALRLKSTDNPAGVKSAYIERNGDVSVVSREKKS